MNMCLKNNKTFKRKIKTKKQTKHTPKKVKTRQKDVN